MSILWGILIFWCGAFFGMIGAAFIGNSPRDEYEPIEHVERDNG